MTPVSSLRRGRSDKGPPLTSLKVWIYATKRGGAAAASESPCACRIECGNAHAVAVKARSAAMKALRDDIVICAQRASERKISDAVSAGTSRQRP